MRPGSSIAALLLLSLTACVVATRLSVFREDFNGVPGRTFIVVHDDGDNTGSGGVLPGGVAWLFQQMAMLRAMQGHLVLNSLPPLPNAMADAPDGEDTLRRVRCQRMRQAMIEEDQDIWGSTFGGDSDIRTTSSEPVAAVRNDDDEAPRCYDVHGRLVACNSDDAVMQDNWLDITRPVDTSEISSLASLLPTRNEPRTKDAATSTDPWTDGADGGDATDASLSTTLDVLRRPSDTFDDGVTARLLGDDDGLEDSQWGQLSSGADGDGEEGGAVSDDSSGDLLFSGQEPTVGRPWEGLHEDQVEEEMMPPYRPRHAALAGRPSLLAVSGVLCAALATLGAVALLALAALRRRWSPYGDMDAVLVAPLLSKDGSAAGPVKVYGIKVAAAEAQRDAVEGIDTSAALLKGQGLPRSG